MTNEYETRKQDTILAKKEARERTVRWEENQKMYPPIKEGDTILAYDPDKRKVVTTIIERMAGNGIRTEVGIPLSVWKKGVWYYDQDEADHIAGS